MRADAGRCRRLRGTVSKCGLLEAFFGLVLIPFVQKTSHAGGMGKTAGNCEGIWRVKKIELQLLCHVAFKDGLIHPLLLTSNLPVRSDDPQAG